MISYMDMRFCAAECENMGCPRNYTPEVHKAATEWGGEDAPVAFSDFSGTCGDYVIPKGALR
jgi:hypothetical protein